MNSRSVLVFLVAAAAVSGGGCGGSVDEREPSWAYISAAIMQPACATSSCHSKGAAVSGLNMSTAADGYSSLVELSLPTRRTGATDVPRSLVLPFNPDQSRLVNMLRARGAMRMPPDRPLPEGDIQLVERWILMGAPNN